MIVGIDIRLLARGAHTGIEEYTTNLISNLVVRAKNVHFKFFYNALRKERLNYPWLELENVELKTFSFPNRFFDFVLGGFSYPKIDKLIGGCEVFLSPHFFIAPVSKKCRKVVVFHDLSFEYYPDFFSLPKRYWHFSMNPRKTAREADQIIAVSESTKADLVNLYGIEPQKIQVIYPGVNKSFKPIEDKNELGRVKEKYGLPEKFILYFGTIEPRKNIIGIIKAFELLKRSRATHNPKSLKLVIAGAKGWLYRDVLKEAQRSKYKTDIVFTGFVDNKDKPYLYSLAKLFVYPSFFEGFGFPPLEAMACGVPTIVSHVTSLPEVVEEAAVMVNPYMYREIADAMQILLEDESSHVLFSKRGIEQAKNFSWENSTKQVLDIILK